MFCQILFSKSTSTLNVDLQTLKILNVKSQKSKSLPKTSQTPSNYLLAPGEQGKYILWDSYVQIVVSARIPASTNCFLNH